MPRRIDKATGKASKAAKNSTFPQPARPTKRTGKHGSKDFPGAK